MHDAGLDASAATVAGSSDMSRPTNYDPHMSRTAMVLSGIVIAGLTGFSGAAVAHAGPPPPCSYTLSPPQVTQLDGVSMVTATVTPAECGFPARPGLAVSCVQPQGPGSVASCSQGSGEDPAQVYVPYHPGTTYVSTGRACGAWAGIRELASDWQLLGPLTATL